MLAECSGEMPEDFVIVADVFVEAPMDDSHHEVVRLKCQKQYQPEHPPTDEGRGVNQNPEQHPDDNENCYVKLLSGLREPVVPVVCMVWRWIGHLGNLSRSSIDYSTGVGFLRLRRLRLDYEVSVINHGRRYITTSNCAFSDPLFLNSPL